MANPNRNNKPDIEHSEQVLFNQSFDREFNVLASENLAFDPTTNSLHRVVINPQHSSDVEAAVVTATSSGDTTIHTPASGKAIRLIWVSAINDPDESSTPLIKILLGNTELYRGYALSHAQVFEGAVDEVLKVNLSAAASVAVTAHLIEFTP